MPCWGSAAIPRFATRKSATYSPMQPCGVMRASRVLGDLPKRERLAWGNRVAGSLASRFPGLSLHISILAGLEYATPIQRASLGHGWVIETPLAGLSIGQRLAWLKERGKTRAT
jgi:hypothetical protein